MESDRVIHLINFLYQLAGENFANMAREQEQADRFIKQAKELEKTINYGTRH